MPAVSILDVRYSSVITNKHLRTKESSLFTTATAGMILEVPARAKKHIGGTMFEEFDQPLVQVADRDIYEGATDLIDHFGTAADIEASARADACREQGNIYLFARWRQIERLIPVLISEEVIGTLH